MKVESVKRYEWRRRRVASSIVRASTVLVPLVLAVVLSVGLGKLIPTSDSIVATVARLVLILLVTTVAMRWVSARMQRLLPLAVMLKLSWAFPDEVPGRFSVALRHARYKQALVDAADTDPSAATVTTHLLELVRQLNGHHRATRGHSERVRAYADLLGEELKLTADQRDKLCWAALLHDIGKIGVPVEILDFPGKPSAEQWEVLAKHPANGETIATPVLAWLGEWASGVWEHHERWDGTGYPRRLAGSGISESGRIVAVADAFETMTAVRAYKRPMSIDDARKELVACAGSHFDPNVVRAFLAIGLGRVQRVRGLAALFQAPLVVFAQAGEVGKTLLRGAATGSSAAVAVSVGAVVAAPISPPDPPRFASAPTIVTVGQTPEPTASTVVLALPEGDAGGGALLIEQPTTVTTAPPTTAPSTSSSSSSATVSAPETSLAPEPPSVAPTTAKPTPTLPKPPTTSPPRTTLPQAPPTSSVASTTLTPTTIEATTTVPATTSTTTTTITTTTSTTTAPTTSTTIAATTTTVAPLSALDDQFTVEAGQNVVVSPLGNDVGQLVVTSVRVVARSGGMQATANADGTITIRVANGQAGVTKYVTYEVCDVSGACGQAVITVFSF